MHKLPLLILFLFAFTVTKAQLPLIKKEATVKPKKAIVKPKTNTVSKTKGVKKINPIGQIANDMVLVQGGSFDMGSNDGNEDEKPVHTVTVGNFYISKYEVTQAEWLAVVGNNPSNFSGCDNCPAENVSYGDAVAFCEKLSQQTGQTYRLPTEAEWEYAARGGRKSKGYNYSGSNYLNAVTWYQSNSGRKTHPVGQKQANELGLYDMSGNVWEWCSDWYGENYYASSPASNPEGPSTGAGRVIRGGSWDYFPEFCRVARRYGNTPAGHDGSLSFRLVHSL